MEKHRLIYVADEETATFPATAFEKDTRRQSKLKAFKTTLRERQVIQSFSTPDDLAEKIERDIQRDFPQVLPQPVNGLEAEFANSLKVLREFRLTPKRLNGTEVRLSVALSGSFYPASRALCEQFNLEYGSTVGIYIKIKVPDDSFATQGLTSLYATGKRVDALRQLKAEKKSEIYASLLFSAIDVDKVRAEFFGQSYYPQEQYDPSDDDGSVYVPPEGRVIMLFTKSA